MVLVNSVAADVKEGALQVNLLISQPILPTEMLLQKVLTASCIYISTAIVLTFSVDP